MQMNDMDNLGGTGALLTHDDDAQQMPLGLGDDPAFGVDAVGSGGTGESKSKTPLILLLVVAVAGATLYGMRMTGGIDASDKSVSEAEKKIEAALERLGGGASAAADPLVKRNLDELFKDTDDVIALFGDDPTSKQVELENVKKNPFELIMIRKESSEPTAKAVEAIDRVKQQRLAALKKELEGIKLQSIMSGKTALAVIDGKVVREGDTVGSFQITSISPYGVRLAAEGNIYTISMKKPETN